MQRNLAPLRRLFIPALMSLALAATLAPFPSQADTIDIQERALALPMIPGGGDFSVRTRTFAEKRFVNVVRQQFDFSCGSAALATLLTYNYDLPVSEFAILKDMYDRGDKQKIHREGFSMLDMKTYLGSLGIKADGYKESLSKLNKVGVPAIVLINRNGYSHFVVVKGVTNQSVMVGDPAQGLRVYSRDEFQSMWNGILFVILDMKPIARKHFNDRTLWAKKNRAIDSELAQLANDGISTLSLDTIRNPNFF